MKEQSEHGEDKEGSCHISVVAKGPEHVVVAAFETVTQTGEGAAPDGDSNEREQRELVEGHLAQAGT
jgi:hypothetical protein